MMDRLTALPTELISSIAIHLDDHGLLDFRLTCSRAKACADEAFLERFFQDRRQLCTEYSLRVLWEISRNARLRGRLRSLTLVFIRLQYVHIEGHLARKHRYGTFCDNDTWPRCDNVDYWDHRYEIVEWCSEIFEAALENLAAAGLVLELSAVTCEGWLALPMASAVGTISQTCLANPVLYGTTTLERSLVNIRPRPQRSDWAEGHANDVVSFVLVATARSHYPVQKLSLANGDDVHCANPGAFDALSGSLDFPWENLKQVSLTVHSNCLDATELDLTPFQQWISSLRALESFSLTVEDSIVEGHDQSHLWPGRCARLGLCLMDKTLLQTLTLSNLWFSTYGLRAILRPLRSTLRRLALTNAYLPGGDRWSSSFTWMAQHLDLEYAHFTLGQDDGNLRSETGDGYQGWTLIGDAHVVKQGLERMASNAVFAYSGGVMNQEEDEFSDDGIDDEDFLDVGTLAIS